MVFDVIDITDEEVRDLTTVQKQLLRTAQKKKNEMRRKLEQDMKLFQKLVLTDGMQNSSLLQQKRDELENNFEYELGIIVEQLRYAMNVSEPPPDDGSSGGDESAGYIVDYSLPYTDRYNMVRDYYLSIRDPAERMSLYGADDVAKQYLDSYYGSLYSVLLAYSK